MDVAESGQKVRCVQAEDSGEVRGSQVVKCGMRSFVGLYLMGSGDPLQVPKQIDMLRGGFWETDSGGW